MSDIPADELLRIALAHIDVRLREYDSDKNIVRVNRKFVEILTKYGPILRTLSKSADFWRSRVTVLEEENTALREKINNLTAFNDDLRDAVDDLKKQTNEYVTVISRVTHNSRKWRTRAQEWRARAEKAESLNEQSNLRQHGRTAFIKYGKHGGISSAKMCCARKSKTSIRAFVRGPTRRATPPTNSGQWPYS